MTDLHFPNQREKALERDRHQCQYCGFDGDVDVHHIRHRYNGGTHELDNLVTLCRSCHKIAHSEVSDGENPLEVLEENDVPTDFVDRDGVSRWAAPILDELHDGRCTPQYIAEQTNINRDRANQTLSQMLAAGWVRKLSHGLYELVDDPRDD